MTRVNSPNYPRAHCTPRVYYCVYLVLACFRPPNWCPPFFFFLPTPHRACPCCRMPLLTLLDGDHRAGRGVASQTRSLNVGEQPGGCVNSVLVPTHLSGVSGNHIGPLFYMVDADAKAVVDTTPFDLFTEVLQQRQQRAFSSFVRLK